MSEIKPPYDYLGGELREGDLVAVFPNMHLVGKVLKIQLGGVATPRGTTPQEVKVAVVFDIKNIPGMRITSLVRVVNPASEGLVDKILES